MKKALTIAATFLSFFVGFAVLLYLMALDNVTTITEILVHSLLADVTWHIMFYVVMPRLRKTDKA